MGTLQKVCSTLIAGSITVFLWSGFEAWDSSANAQEKAQPHSYVLATATTGGTYHPVGVALASLVKLKLLPSHSIDLTAVNSAGSGENLDLLMTGETDFALMTGLFGYYARTGAGPAAAYGPTDNVQAIANVWPNADHFVIPGYDVQTGTIDDFIALQNRKVLLGRPNSGAIVIKELMLKSMGIDIKKHFDLQDLSHGEGTEALLRGEIAGANLVGGLPVAAVTRLFEEADQNMHILEITEEQLVKIDAGRGIWSRQIIPANTYPGQPHAIGSIGTTNFLAVRADMDEEVVYQITKTMFENLPLLHGIHGATREISLDRAVSGLPVSLHPGALRYYREIGLAIPALTAQAGDSFLQRYESSDEAQSAINERTVGILTGDLSSGDLRMASDLCAVLDDGDELRVIAMSGERSAEHLSDLIYLKGVDAAIIQADLLEYAKREQIYPNVVEQIRYIAKLYDHEVHLVARDEIQSVRDLVGKKVNFGVEGSSTELTAAILFDTMQIPVIRTSLDTPLALSKLKTGELSAVLVVGAKPLSSLQELGAEDGLKLLSLPAIDYANVYRSATLHVDDYPHLITSDRNVETMAVPAILTTYNWQPDADGYAAVARFVLSLFAQLPELQGPGRHPKWREVDLTDQLPGWQRWQPADAWVKKVARLE